ncbi:hypothetical protein PCE1_000623 [Barthelona sp. PCE]
MSGEIFAEPDPVIEYLGGASALEELTTQEMSDRAAAYTYENDYYNQLIQQINVEVQTKQEEANRNRKKIKHSLSLPYIVATVSELIELPPENVDGEEDEDTSTVDVGSKSRLGCIVKASDSRTMFLPVLGLLRNSGLKTGDLIACKRDSYLLVEKLPTEFDARVQAMELDERPQESWDNIGGLDKEIEMIKEAIELPMTHPELFEKVGCEAPKGVLFYGPPGTGKTLMARACAANVNATFLKLAGPMLVQSHVGEGAMLVRDAFRLAKEKQPTIIFIDELDAIGMKRSGEGSRGVERTMLELLNQLDGFDRTDGVKVIAATNRVDILDPALMRSGRLDRKIKLPIPNEEARLQILQIHAKNLHKDKEVNLLEIAAATDQFNGAQLKAVCVEAGMIALRRNAKKVFHDDFVEGISAVLGKKKKYLSYFS